MKYNVCLTNGFDPERFTREKLPCLDHNTINRKPPRHKPGEEFLRGPIPLPWLKQAAVLRGKALAVAVALWFKAGATKRCEVKCSSVLWAKLGIKRKSAYRGLRALERAGLIKVKRHVGRAPLVTILEFNNSIPEKGVYLNGQRDK